MLIFFLTRYYILWYYPLDIMRKIDFEYDYRILQNPKENDELPEGCDRVFYPGEIEQIFIESRGSRNFNHIDRKVRGRR